MMYHYCPLDGLEYRSLRTVGWTECHRLTVDGAVWVKLKKHPASKAVLSCLN